MRRGLTALAAGALFGFGLVVSGMTDPRNVVGFLDVAGRWNPTLAAVMAGAVGVHMFGLRWLRARSPIGNDERAGPWPAEPLVDARLIGGAAIFGVGWGLAGYCPGPAIVALGSGAPAAWGFVAAMVVGVLAGERVSRAPAGAPAPARGASAC